MKARQFKLDPILEPNKNFRPILSLYFGGEKQYTRDSFLYTPPKKLYTLQVCKISKSFSIFKKYNKIIFN